MCPSVLLETILHSHIIVPPVQVVVSAMGKLSLSYKPPVKSTVYSPTHQPHQHRPPLICGSSQNSVLDCTRMYDIAKKQGAPDWTSKSSPCGALTTKRCSRLDKWIVNPVLFLIFPTCSKKNPANGRHQLSQLMRIVGPIQI